MQFPGLNAVGSLAAVAAEAPAQNTPVVTRVTPGCEARDAGCEGRQHAEQDAAAARARDIAALRREMERRGLPAGPPPAFQMNLLEAESGVSQVIARIEAARAQERDAPALRPATEAPAPAPDPAAAPDPATPLGATPLMPAEASETV